MLHICVGNLGHHWLRWWLVACSAPIHHLNQCWIIVNCTLGNKLLWNFNRNSNIFIQENAFKNVVCEIVAICLGLNMLTFWRCQIAIQWQTYHTTTTISLVVVIKRATFQQKKNAFRYPFFISCKEAFWLIACWIKANCTHDNQFVANNGITLHVLLMRDEIMPFI